MPASHLEEEEEGELLGVVAVGEAVIPENVAVISKFWTSCGAGLFMLKSCGNN